jgi:hypothetical protein
VIIPFDVPFAFLDPSPDLRNRAREILKQCERELGKPNSLRRHSKQQVIFELPHVFHTYSSYVANARALRSLLKCLTDLDSAYLQFYPETPDLYDTEVYYRRTVVWDTTPSLYERGYGDCKSLTCSFVAELRRQGEEAIAVFRFMPDDELLYHILVLGQHGWHDPSKECGMLLDENKYFTQTG